MFLRQVFEGYVLTMRKRNHSSEHGLDDDTRREPQHFSELGESLGSFTSFESKRAGVPMDVAWWATKYGIPPRHAVIPGGLVLHLERENYRAKNNKTIERLMTALSPEPQFSIAILANVFRGSLASFEQYIDSKSMGRNLLVIAWINEVDSGVHGGDFHECRAIVYGEGQRFSRAAQVSKDQAGFWNGHVDSRQWTEA